MAGNNHCCGDPDDNQSLCILLNFADEPDILAIIPDRSGLTDDTGGVIATLVVMK